MAQYTFDQIKSLHEQMRSEGKLLGQMDLRGFAAHMQQTDPENDWSQGQLPDNFITSISRGVDKGFAATGLPEATGAVGGSLGSLIDSVRGNPDQKYEQIGTSVGEGIPRAAAGMGLAIGGAALTGLTGGTATPATGPAMAAGLSMMGLGAADAGMKAYSDTGSKMAGALGAGTTLLAPGISSAGTKLGVGTLGRVAPALAQNPVAKFVAAEIGQQAAFFGAVAAQTAVQGENPFTPENVFAQGVQIAAFAPLTVARGIGAAKEKAPFVPGGTELIPHSTKFTTGKATEGLGVSDAGKLFDFVTGKNDEALTKAYGSGNLKQALELTGMVDPDINNALEISQRRYKGRELISTLAEQNDPKSWEANDRLFKKAATLLQVPEVDVRNIVQMIAAVNAFERKFKGEGPAGFLMNRPQFQDTAALEQFNNRMMAGTQEAMQQNKLFADADVSAQTRSSFNSLDQKRQREREAEAAKYGNPENNITDETLAQPRDYTEPDGQQPARVRGRVKEKTLQERFNEEQQTNPATENPAAPKKTGLEAWADAKIAEGKTRMNSGLDPELLSAYAVKGAYHLARGIRDFAQWSAEMIGKFGEAIKPHLDTIYKESNSLVEGNHGAKRPVRDYKVHSAYDALPSRVRGLLDHFDIGVKEIDDAAWDHLEAQKAKYGMAMQADGHAVLNQNRIDLRANNRFGGQEQIIPHELGHLLDKKFGVLEQFADVDQEVMQNLMDAGIGTFGGKNAVLDTEGLAAWQKGAKEGDRNGLVGEAIGEGLGQWLKDPDEFKVRYPKLADKFQEVLGQHLPGSKRMSRPEWSKVEPDNGLPDSEVFRFVKEPIKMEGDRIAAIGRAVVPQDGLVHENRFQSSAQMPKQVFDLVKQVYPEAWQGDKVDVNKLRQLEQERPMFETHVYGQDGKGTPEKAELDQLTHEWYDTQSSTVRNRIDTYRYEMDSEGALSIHDAGALRQNLINDGVDLAKLDRWIELGVKVEGQPDARGPRATSYYNTISPFDTTKYPVVRIDVTVPHKQEMAEPGNSLAGWKRPLWPQDDLHENLPNTLGWAMVQFVPDPRTGETVMFVAEQQSRWGQSVAKDKAAIKKGDDGNYVVNRMNASRSRRLYEQDHPLLDHQHKLVLKAAMDEARKRGVTKMVVSDGETAMMTERHDAQNNGDHRSFSQKEYAEQFVKDNPSSKYSITEEPEKGLWIVTERPSQEGGMRQHYDSVLQSAAEKMTKSKGEPVDMGVHKNAVKDLDMVGDPEPIVYDRKVPGSPVFRNPDGTPKATATGKMYNIEGDIVDRVKYSKIENPLFDANGEITGKTFEEAYYRNLDLERDPDLAMARTDAQVRGALMSKMKDTRPDMFVQDGLAVASRAFDEMGLDRGLKDAWLECVYRVLNTMNVFEGTRIRTLDDMVKNGLIDATEAARSYGVYLPYPHHIGIETRSRQATPELGMFHFVKTLGHESLHAVIAKAESEMSLGIDNKRIRAYRGALEYADSVDIGMRESHLRDLQSAVVPHEHIMADLQLNNRLGNDARIAAGSSEEFIVEYGAILAMSLTRPERLSKVQEHLRWAPQVLQDFAHGLFRTMDELRKMVLSTAQFLGLNVGEVQKLNQFHENLKTMLTPDAETVRAQKSVQDALQPFRVINGEVSPMEAKWSKVDSPAVEEELQKYRVANLFEKRFGTLQQHVNSMRVKEAIPNASRVIDTLTHLGADIKKSLNVMRSQLLVTGDGGLLHELATTPDKSLSPEQIALKSNFGRVENSMENRVLLSKVYLRMNESTRDTNDNITFDYSALKEIWSTAKPEDQAAMRAVFDAQLEVNRNAAGLVKLAFLDRTKLDIARIYKGAGLFEKDAMQSAGVLLDHLLQGRPVPPELNQVAGTDNAVNFWNDVRPSFEELSSTLDRPHASELRTGRWQIAYTTPDGLDGRVSANNKQELAAIQRELVKQGNKIKGLPVDNQNKEFNEFDAVPTAMAESMLRLEQARFDSALKNLADIMPDAAEKIRSEYTLGQAISEEVNKRKQFLAERKYSAGREYIDMYSNQGAYAEVVAASVTKKLARNRIAWEMESDNWAKDPGLQKEVETFAHDILSTRNTSELTQNIKKATMGVTMGLNVSGAVMDSMQALMVGAFRVGETMGVPKAFKTIAKGYIEAFNPRNKEFQAILARATNDGLLQSGASMNDIFTIDDVAGYNVARSGDRRNLATLGDHLTDREFMAGKVFDMIKAYGGKLFNGMMVPTKASGQLNNKVMLYAGMVEGKKLGLSGEELYRHATRVSQVTNFQGGRGAQSSFKTKFGQANNWVEVATLLTNYPISVMSQMYGNYRSMLKSSGLSPAKRQRAAEVFAGQLTLQFAMAGSLGLGLGSLFKVAEQIFGFSPEEEVRKGLAEIDASGNLADVLLTGLANKATGVDFASRFSLGGVMGLNDYSGFDAKGLFGPSTTLWGGIANIPKDISEGRLDKSLLLPNGIRKMIEATSAGPIKDRNGQTLIEPTTTERIVKFIGFNSDRLSKVRKQRELYKFADEATQRESQIKTNQRIEQMQKGDFNAVLAGIQSDLAPEIASWREQGIAPMVLKQKIEKETRERALRLVNAAVQKSMPLDPLAGGDTASSFRRRKIAASFGTGLAPREITATQQALAARLLQGLGQAAVQRSPKSVRISRLAQELINNDPTLTEQDARVIAESQIR